MRLRWDYRKNHFLDLEDHEKMKRLYVALTMRDHFTGKTLKRHLKMSENRTNLFLKSNFTTFKIVIEKNKTSEEAREVERSDCGVL